MVARGLIQPEPARTEVLPLTERILKWLPGPRWLWIILWALLPFVRLVELVAIVRLVGQEPRPEYLSYRLPYELVASFLVLLSFWAVRKWTHEVKALQPTSARLTKEDGLEIFRGMANRSWPILLMVVLVVMGEIAFIPQHGVLARLLVAPQNFIIGLPVVVGFWVYLCVLAGLNRLGGYKLPLEPFPEDRSLGLRPVGNLAFSAFWVFALGIVPLLLVSIRSPVDLIISLIIFLLGVAIFFVSLLHLHWQMVAARRHYLERVRGIFSQVLGPLRISPSPDILREQAPLLSATEVLMHQAEAVQRWPFDDSTLRVITTIITGVIAALISRLILTLLGI